MQENEVKAFIKLGTAVRYLKDVWFKIAIKPEPLGGKNVISNIQTVIRLTENLQLVGTLESGGYRRLLSILVTLIESSRTTTNISTSQALVLHRIAEDVRLSLLTEGKVIHTYYLSETEIRKITSSEWPEKITMDLLKRTPIGVWKWFAGWMLASFLAGTALAESGIISRVKGWAWSSNSESISAPESSGGAAVSNSKLNRALEPYEDEAQSPIACA